MSLNWDIKECKDPDLLVSEVEWPVTQYMIFSTMAIGIGRITEANAPKVYARLRMLENLREVPSLTQPEDVQRRIGLKTNASFKDESDVRFLGRLRYTLDDFAQSYRRATSSE